MQTASSPRDITLPARWGVMQRTKNSAIYFLVRAARALMRQVPYVITLRVLWLLGLVASVLPLDDLRRAKTQLLQAMPELGEGGAKKTTRAMVRHLARAAAESLHIERFLSGPHALTLREEDRRLLDEAFAEGHGVVAVTGHIGNWELLAQVVTKAGYPVSSIAKPTYDPRLTAMIHEERTRFGMQLIWRGDDTAGKDMLRVFRNKGMLALLIDQDTKVDGAFVPFFGRPAHTPTAAAALALRFSAPIIVAWDHYIDGKHELHFERVSLIDTGNRDADVVTLTATLSARLEHAVRLHPEQWVWMHRRWKKQPPTVA